MLNFENMSRPEMIAARRAIRDNLDTLTAIYNTARSAGPAETVAQLVERIGKAAAVAVVADLVNATSPADLDRMHVYPSIHPAHICQLAEAARNL